MDVGAQKNISLGVTSCTSASVVIALTSGSS
jgi:hypothetical protein